MYEDVLHKLLYGVREEARNNCFSFEKLPVFDSFLTESV